MAFAHQSKSMQRWFGCSGADMIKSWMSIWNVHMISIALQQMAAPSAGNGQGWLVLRLMVSSGRYNIKILCYVCVGFRVMHLYIFFLGMLQDLRLLCCWY